MKKQFCNQCGNIDLKTVLMPKNHMHYAKLVCAECNDKFITWAKKPENIDKNTRNNNNKFKWLHRERNNQYICTWCGADETIWKDNLGWTFQLDHIHQLSEGGIDEYDNTQILCFVCHGDKTSRRKEIQMFKDRLNKEVSK